MDKQGISSEGAQEDGETRPGHLMSSDLSTRGAFSPRLCAPKVFEMVPLMVAFGHDINGFTSKKMGTLLCISIVSAP